ncbi:gluzincin family metallopeptidase [Acuticoccus sediminis]|uniref:hypothetical protein n=1 Tax=Acuticoccus sediminis TaxID=2184697 RepID=UPI001CFD304A|nr:hypothetical protein [Acuticoccus sediminis]
MSTHRRPSARRALAALAVLAAVTPAAAQQREAWADTPWVIVCADGSGLFEAMKVDYPGTDTYCTLTPTQNGQTLETVSLTRGDIEGLRRAFQTAARVYDGLGLPPPFLPRLPDPDWRASGGTPKVGFPVHVSQYLPGVYGRYVPGTTTGPWEGAAELWVEHRDQTKFTATGLADRARRTAIHELAHAVFGNWMDNPDRATHDAANSPQWITEGLPDMFATLYALHVEGMLSLDALDRLPALPAPKSRTYARYSAPGGLAISGHESEEDDQRSYDTATFWMHLFSERNAGLGLVRELSDLFERDVTKGESGEIVDGWLRDRLGTTLPEAFARFIADVTDPALGYRKALGDYLSCGSPLPVSWLDVGPVRVTREPFLREGTTAPLGGLRVTCMRYSVGLETAAVTVDARTFVGDALPPVTMRIFADGVDLSGGGALVVPAGPPRDVVVAAIQTGDAYSRAPVGPIPAIDLRFESTPWVPCDAGALRPHWTRGFVHPLFDTGQDVASPGGRTNESFWNTTSLTVRNAGGTASYPACGKLTLARHGDVETLRLAVTVPPRGELLDWNGSTFFQVAAPAGKLWPLLRRGARVSFGPGPRVFGPSPAYPGDFHEDLYDTVGGYLWTPGHRTYFAQNEATLTLSIEEIGGGNVDLSFVASGPGHTRSDDGDAPDAWSLEGRFAGSLQRIGTRRLPREAHHSACMSARAELRAVEHTACVDAYNSAFPGADPLAVDATENQYSATNHLVPLASPVPPRRRRPDPGPNPDPDPAPDPARGDPPKDEPRPVDVTRRPPPGTPPGVAQGTAPPASPVGTGSAGAGGVVPSLCTALATRAEAETLRRLACAAERGCCRGDETPAAVRASLLLTDASAADAFFLDALGR